MIEPIALVPFVPGGKDLARSRELFRELGCAELLAVSLIVSPNIPEDEVTLLDAADFTTATSDVPVFEVSEVAALHEEDTAPVSIACERG